MARKGVPHRCGVPCSPQTRPIKELRRTTINHLEQRGSRMMLGHSMSAARSKLPPFARELVTARRRGQRVNLFIHAGDRAWDRARSRRPPDVLCLPPGEDFRTFDWSIVRGLSLVLVWWNGSPAEVDAFARHLVLSGAELVAALGATHDGKHVGAVRSTFYRPARPAPRRAA